MPSLHILVAACLLLTLITPGLAAPRMVLMEKFSNTNWGSCGSAEPIFVQFAQDHADDCAAILFHVWWPWSGDPFYLFNTVENVGRTNFYNLDHVPTELFDGRVEPNETYTYADLLEAYNLRKAVPTDVTLQITGSYDGATGAVQVDLAASTTSPLPAGDYRLHIVLTEGGIYYEAANGIDWHEYTMRDMVNDHEGLPVSFAGDLPQNAAASVSFSLDPLFIPENCEIVCFLQNANNREVWQSAKVMVSDLASDATGIAASESPFRLGAAYPNPFNPETRIPVSLRESGQVRLEILDVGGRLLRVLHEGELPAGRREFTWDGRDGAGVSLGSGVYLSRLSLGTETRSRRLVLIK